MRNRRRVTNRGHANSSIVDGANRRLATTTRPLYAHFALLHPRFHRFARGFICGLLRCERSAFARSAETTRARRGLRDQVSFEIGNRDHRVVERRRDVRDTSRDIFLLFFAEDLFLATRCCCFCHYFLPGAFFFATVARRGPLRVRALVCVRWPRTGSPRR